MTDLATLSIDIGHLRSLIELAFAEDLGHSGDITTQACGLHGDGCGTLRARTTGIICGLALIPHILAAVDEHLTFSPATGVRDGSTIDADHVLGTITGPYAAMLTSERTVLNFVQRLSGIATMTGRFVAAVDHTPATIYDTRKTTPGWRDLEKYAVRCGGGHNHRSGLHDAILIKDNHIAGTDSTRLGHALFEILNEAGNLRPAPRFIEVEVDTLDQLEQVFTIVGIDIVLLDNFTLADMRAAVARRNALNLQERVALEASGGVTLDSVSSIAETGVDRIAVGALTHSATALDVGLDIYG